MPHLDPDKDVTVTLENDVLTRSFTRAVGIPSRITAGQVKASYADGVLEVCVPVNTHSSHYRQAWQVRDLHAGLESWQPKSPVRPNIRTGLRCFNTEWLGRSRPKRSWHRGRLPWHVWSYRENFVA